MTCADFAIRQFAAHPPIEAGRRGITHGDAEDSRRLVLGSMGYMSMLLGPWYHLERTNQSCRHWTWSRVTLLLRSSRTWLKANVTSAFVFPKLAIDLASDESSLQNIERLQHVSFGGASPPSKISAKLSARTQLNPYWSSTETGVSAFQEPDADALDCVVVDSHS